MPGPYSKEFRAETVALLRRCGKTPASARGRDSTASRSCSGSDRCRKASAEQRLGSLSPPKGLGDAGGSCRQPIPGVLAGDAVEGREVEVVIQGGAPEPERAGDLAHRHLAALAHRQRRGPLFGCELERAAAEAPGGLGDLPARLGALADQLALELRQGGEQVQLQLPRGGRGVDRLPQGLERSFQYQRRAVATEGSSTRRMTTRGRWSITSRSSLNSNRNRMAGTREAKRRASA